jgi:hypothetical protein
MEFGSRLWSVGKYELLRLKVWKEIVCRLLGRAGVAGITSTR